MYLHIANYDLWNLHLQSRIKVQLFFRFSSYYQNTWKAGQSAELKDEVLPEVTDNILLQQPEKHSPFC